MAVQIITRAEARALGLKRYFTGKACRNRGHIAERLCSNGECLACVREDSPARSRKRRLADPGKAKDRQRRWRRANPDKAKAIVERWRAANPEKWRESNRRSKQANQKKYNENQRLDYALNPEKYRTVERRRRAQKHGSNGTHTAADLSEILAAQGNRCAYCRANLKRVKKHVDHIKPLALGGSNGRENLQYLCAPCNQSKSAKDPVDYAKSIGLLI